ncbi:AraC family transcriptional regulator [Isoalcanivorax indicus]|uniref:AraC family transcriptional regulator n=1 Tax=Isoalcanivorax indicus TaxID=2202653 RepID=UPI0013C52A3F|nr:AraC family transcriptional regulator [Isoalcanivorax indicus]
MTPYSPRSRGDTTAAADQRILMARLVRHLTDRATELGIDTGAALKAAGLGTANWDDPRHTVAVRQLEALLDHLLHTSGEQQLGLRIAEAATPEAFGVVGYIRQACGTFGEFIEMCMRYEHLISSIGKTSLLHQPGRVLLCWEVVTEHPAFRRHATEYMLAALASTRQLLPPEQRQCLLAVHFHHGPPATGADLDMYRQLFQCPIRFDQPQSALVLPREALQYRFSSADVALLQALERHALHLADNEPTSNLVERARLSLHTLVLEGRASREALADTLGISMPTSASAPCSAGRELPDVAQPRATGSGHRTAHGTGPAR